MAIKKDILANALKIRGSQSIGDSIYRRLKSVSTDEQIKSFDSEENNSLQTVHERSTEKNTNGPQSGYDLNTNGAHKNTTVHERFTEKNTNGSQTVPKRNTEKNTNGSQNSSPKNISHLTGIQRKLMLSIYLNCKIFGGTTSQEMTIEHLSNLSKCNKKSIKTTIYRLKEKGFIQLVEQKIGRGGWAKYKIDQNIYSDILHQEKQIFSNYSDIETDNRFTNRTQVVYNRDTEPNTQPYTTLSSSSSLKKLTTKEEETEMHSNTTVLPPEWESIDFSFLEDIGFNKNKLLQIYGAGYLTAEMVQESLYGYDFDRKHNNVKVNSPINFLMAQLKMKGLPYDLPKNYESPKVRAMREYLERMEANEKKEQELKDALKTREFEKWLNNLSLEEQNTLVPPHGMFAKGGPRRAAFFKHFDENHWAEKEKVLFAGIFS